MNGGRVGRSAEVEEAEETAVDSAVITEGKVGNGRNRGKGDLGFPWKNR